MFVVMKKGKYFTGDVAKQAPDEIVLWTRHPASAKVWKVKRSWAEKAADRWGGKVVEWQEDTHQDKRSVNRDTV